VFQRHNFILRDLKVTSGGLYGCEMSFVTVKEEHKLHASEKNVLWKTFGHIRGQFKYKPDLFITTKFIDYIFFKKEYMHVYLHLYTSSPLL